MGGGAPGRAWFLLDFGRGRSSDAASFARGRSHGWCEQSSLSRDGFSQSQGNVVDSDLRARLGLYASRPACLLWPQSLRTALDICLSSAFPTFLWWGPQLIQFYNDPALQILRAKHPSALGIPAREAWPEVWATVGPLVERVLSTGEPVSGEDMQMTLNRGEGLQAAYFTFEYSAVRDETGTVAGMLATALETTQRVLAEQSRRESAKRFTQKAHEAGLSSDFRALLEAVPTPFVVLAPPEFTIVAVNEAYLATSMTRRNEILGRRVFDVFPDDPAEDSPMGAQKLRA